MILVQGVLLGLCALMICSRFFVCAAEAVEPTGRAEEIRNRVAKIGDRDPIERIIAAEDTLASEDPALRSLALERILGSDDPRVREIGFSYLVGTQKRFVINIEASAKSLEEMKNQILKAFITNNPTFLITVEKYEKKLGQFVGADGVSNVTGSIALDGLTVLLSLGTPCRLQFRKGEPTYLAGSLDCGPYSFLARSALP